MYMDNNVFLDFFFMLYIIHVEIKSIKVHFLYQT